MSIPSPLPLPSERPDLHDWLGRQVRLVIDRPLGTVHPRHEDIRYPVNYGYVPGTLAADGAPMPICSACTSRLPRPSVS